MKLGIVSDSRHFFYKGQLYNHNQVLTQQLDSWADLFDEVLVCAPLIRGTPPPTASAYRSNHVGLLPVPLAGGNSIGAKATLLLKGVPLWRTALTQLFSAVDTVHVRCPNNISIPALIMLRKKSLPRQAVYTGSWKGYAGEPLTYRWQRWYLRYHFAGPVAVYGHWPNEPRHVIPSFSPSYSLDIWLQEELNVAARMETLRRSQALPPPIKLLSVGRLSINKNQELVIRALKILSESGLPVELTLIGDGPQREELQALARSLGVARQVFFSGLTPHDEVRQYYRKSDFVVQAPLAEGYGKVPVEAFFHGTIPVLSDVGVSSQLVDLNERGRIFPSGDAYALAHHISQLASQPHEVARLITNGRQYAREHTLEAWQQHIRAMLEEHWSVVLGDSV